MFIKKATVLAKYLVSTDFFSKKLVKELFRCLDINEHIGNIEVDK